jgi:hypothetical protein
MSPQGQGPTPEQINGIARAAINAQSVRMEQLIQTVTIPTPLTTSPQVTVQPRNVGLIKGFMVQVQFTVSNGSAVQLNLSDFGPANIFSQVLFNDLANNTRIQTPGWHLHLINTVKMRRPFGMANVAGSMDTPIGYGSNFIGQISAPATIAAGGTAICTMWYWVPLAYDEQDLRGAIYANVIQATMQLVFTFNPNPFVAAGTDSTSAIYFGDVAGSVAGASITTATINVTQVYQDQLPIGPQGVILPVIDLATTYELKQTVLSGVTANQDLAYQYANFRNFLSTIAIYVNTLATGARAGGSDINNWFLRSANNTNIWQRSPAYQALITRQHLGTDLPLGVYYFSSRMKPIVTTQYGNMQLINNPLIAGTGAYQLVAVEDFALTQTLSMAGSLAST